MPEVSVRTAARLLTVVACRAFASAAHLAAYAGLAPVTRRSGSSIRGEPPLRRDNKTLKRSLFLSAFAALRAPISRAYYTHKMSLGKRHNQALITLARRRSNVLFARMVGLEPKHTAVRSPESNGMAESFVKTMKRDYISIMPKPDGLTAVKNLAEAFEHYNEWHPHSALGYRSPREYLRRRTSDRLSDRLSDKKCMEI